MHKIIKMIRWVFCCQCKSCKDSLDMDLMDI